VTKLVSGFEEPAVRRLDALQHAERLRPRAVAEQAQQRVARGQVIMPHLSDGDERRQRVTHDGQFQRGEKILRQRGQLEGKLNDLLPSCFAFAQPPGQRAHREDGHGESAVLAVARDDGGDKLIGFEFGVWGLGFAVRSARWGGAFSVQFPVFSWRRVAGGVRV
jgi:hypothetical protein